MIATLAASTRSKQHLTSTRLSATSQHRLDRRIFWVSQLKGKQDLTGGPPESLSSEMLWPTCLVSLYPSTFRPIDKIVPAADDGARAVGYNDVIFRSTGVDQ